MGKAAARNHAAAVCWDISREVHPAVVRGCSASLCRGISLGEHPATVQSSTACPCWDALMAERADLTETLPSSSKTVPCHYEAMPSCCRAMYGRCGEAPSAPMRPSEQCVLELHASCVTMDALGLPYPGADWLGCETTPTALPSLDAPAQGCNSWVDPGDTSSHGSQAYVKPGSAGELEISKAAAVARMLPPPQELKQPLESTLTRNPIRTHRESQSHHPSAEPKANATIATLPTATLDPVSVWRQVKRAAMASGDYEAAEKIDVPMSDDWKPGARTIEAYPVLRGNGTVPDKYTPFQWLVLSKLRQLVAKYGLGSPAVANLLQIRS